ncbi:MAG: TolC family protein [Bacteroidales bacterium]|nr:TolC family protein [Bacteroidales bacterium]MDD2281091.1 TolC family protein [Bacteroidales bacterium]
MKKILVNKIILFMFFWISFGYTAKGFSKQDSLSQYLEIATKNNPVVLQKYYEYEAALQKVFQVGSLPDPELNAGIFLKPMELIDGMQVADLKLMQMFPWFGVLKNGRNEMSLMAKAKYEFFLDAKLQVSFDVLKTWYELYSIQQNIKISRKNIELLQTIERLSLIKFKSPSSATGFRSQPVNSMQGENSQSSASGSGGMQSMGNTSGNFSGISGKSSSSQMGGSSMESSSGTSGLSDLYRIQIEIRELENSIELLKNSRNTITARFNSYLNRPVNTVVYTPDTLAMVSAAKEIDSNYLSVVENNPMLTMLKYEEQSYQARRQMTKSMGYPMIGLGVNYTIINKSEMSTSPMNGKNMIMPMVSLTLPIFRKKYNAMQREAEMLSSAAKQNYVAVSNSLQTEYLEAIQLFKDAWRRIDLYSGQSELAKKTLDLMIRNFSSAGSSLTDILRIRQQLLDYEYKSVEALTDYNTSVALVNRITAKGYKQ